MVMVISLEKEGKNSTGRGVDQGKERVSTMAGQLIANSVN